MYVCIHAYIHIPTHTHTPIRTRVRCAYTHRTHT